MGGKIEPWGGSHEPSLQLTPAAQYVRASTEHQRYSIENQSAAIALYAAAHNIAIVRSFVDRGKSGTTIRKRHALQQLLQMVQSGNADFQQILAYDVSRWGRYPDGDEAAHYEFLCKRAGIPVHYCAEQFENDNSVSSNLVKALKRTMAAEYSRDLSTKIRAGHQRLAAMGYWQNGTPPFAYLRCLVSSSGDRQILEAGEQKNTSSGRVTLVPGPKHAVDTVRLAFNLYTKENKTRHEIAAILNARKAFIKKRPWDVMMLRELFTNPVYKGTYVYGKCEVIGESTKHRQQGPRIVRDRTFPPIISPDEWKRAHDRVRSEMKPLVDAEMLNDLRRLWKREGYLTVDLVRAAHDVPSVTAYRNHFGSLCAAYGLVGYRCRKEHAFVSALVRTRQLRKKLCEDLCNRIRAVGGQAECKSSYRGIRAHSLLVVNCNLTIKIRCATGRQWGVLSRQTCSRLYLRRAPEADIVVIARLQAQDDSIKDYLVVPAVSCIHGCFNIGENSCTPLLLCQRFQALDALVASFGRWAAINNFQLARATSR